VAIHNVNGGPEVKVLRLELLSSVLFDELDGMGRAVVALIKASEERDGREHHARYRPETDADIRLPVHVDESVDGGWYVPRRLGEQVVVEIAFRTLYRHLLVPVRLRREQG
jgi:hypothetical protein